LKRIEFGPPKIRKEYYPKMRHRTTITIFIVGALAISLTLGTVAYQKVFAATPTTSTATTVTTSAFPIKGLGGNGMKGGYTNEDLANALGISVDTLNTAYQQAHSAALQQAVTDGLITQTQAEELTSSGNAFPFGNRWDGWLAQKGIDFDTYLAQALGISVAALKSAYQTAYNATIDQQVTDGTLTQDQADLMKGEYALYNDSTFQSSMQSAFTAAVNAAVSAGVITQTQADQILSQNDNPMIFGAGIGQDGPHGRGGGFMPDRNSLPSMAP
jgi:hypothetical protein